MTCFKRVNKSSETFLKKCVFKFRLKISRLFDFRNSKGNFFYKKGAHILKARHPYVYMA